MMDDKTNERGSKLRGIMAACARDVVEVCDQVLEQPYSGNGHPNRNTSPIERVEEATDQVIRGWSNEAGTTANGPEETFSHTMAVIELAEAVLVAYLQQRYGLASGVLLTWVPPFLPLRWTSAREREEATAFLIASRLE